MSPDLPSRLFDFHQALQRFPEDSIDAFIEKNKTGPMATIGKVVIAARMGMELLEAASVPPAKEDWLRHIVGKMTRAADTLDDFRNNAAISFVTFNFDTFIERRIRELLRGTYGTVPQDVPPVIHVHGSLPDLPENRSAMNFSMYQPDEAWVNWIGAAAKRIRVTSDELDESTLTAPRSALETASIICFLGFSYHPTNLKRLGIPEIIARKPVFGSAFKMTTSDQATVMDLVSGIELGHEDWNCLELLNKKPICRETANGLFLP